MDPAVGQITVHPINLGQVAGSAYGTQVHLQLLVAAVIAIGQGQVDPFIEAQGHGSADQGFDGFLVIADRVADILDLAPIQQLPETSFLVLLLDRGDILRHMAVKGIADIGPV